MNASSGLIWSEATLADMGRVKERTDFGQRVLAARKHANLSQTELAKKAGLSQSGIVHLETDAESSTKTPLIAQVCGVRTMWLATGEEPMLGPEDHAQAASLVVQEAIAPFVTEPNSARDYRTIAHTLAQALAESQVQLTIQQFLAMVDRTFERIGR